ncbi:hypothetical protein PRUPE_1G253000 [Prunus persica]|uniref:Uncharacterized protein n=1 Tax=Prunus persica TaxID=3760 RepID=M5XM43_PRUPE|nr:hypothetical protein PRUPE_1G253000 [Prunus persica]
MLTTRRFFLCFCCAKLNLGTTPFCFGLLWYLGSSKGAALSITRCTPLPQVQNVGFVEGTLPASQDIHPGPALRN